MDPNRPTLLVAPGHRALLAVRDYNDRFQQEERVGWSELGGQPPPGRLALSPDGRLLAAGSEHRRIQLRDVRRARDAALTVPGPTSDDLQAVSALAFAPSGDLLAVGLGWRWWREETPAEETTRPGTVHLLDVRSGMQPVALPSHRGPVHAIAFTPDGRWVVSAGEDRLLRFWDVAARREAAALEWHIGAVLCLAFAPDGELLATGSADGAVRLWPWRRLLEAAGS